MSRAAQKLQRIKDNPSNLIIWDSPAFHHAGKIIGNRYGVKNVRTDFQNGEKRIHSLQRERGWKPSNGVLLAAIDNNSDASMRFAEAVDENTGLVVETSHYSSTYVALPPGESPSDDEAPGRKPYSSMASRIAYMVGRLSRHAAPEVLVLSYSLEVHWALAKLKRQTEGKARIAMAFFANLWDHRLTDHAGQLKTDEGVEFIQLDDYIEDFFGISKTQKHGEASPGKENIFDAI